MERRIREAAAGKVSVGIAGSRGEEAGEVAGGEALVVTVGQRCRRGARAGRIGGSEEEISGCEKP